LIYPVTDDTFNTSSYYEFGRDYPLTRKKMQFFWDQYIPEKEDRQDILVCPLKASIDQLKGLPPALIISAEIDVIRTGKRMPNFA
jgi:acetyl esterase/lipase